MNSEGVQNRANQGKLCLACGREFSADVQICPDDGSSLVQNMLTDPVAGDVIDGRYVIDRVIGKGGMGIVYLARCDAMDRPVALKMLHAELSQDETSVKRFQQEAKAASYLSHPNLISLEDFGITNGRPYIVMEFLEGVSLLDIIHQQGPLKPDRAVRIFSDCADGLYHAHQLGIIHRDLKPSNIIFISTETGAEQAKVVDFGLAKMMPWSGKKRQQLTRTGEVFGSPIYMSPEQCMGKPLGPTSDIYSLGITIFECITGHPPFRGSTSVDTASLHISGATPRIRDLNPDVDVPESLEIIINKCLEKDPENRFQDMAELKDALLATLKEPAPVSVRRQTHTSSTQSLRQATADLPPKRGPKALIAAGAIALLAGGAAFAWLFPLPQQTSGTVSYYDLGKGELHLLNKKGEIETLTLNNYKLDGSWQDQLNESRLGTAVQVSFTQPVLRDRTSATITAIEPDSKASSCSQSVNTVIRFLNDLTEEKNTMSSAVDHPDILDKCRQLIEGPFRTDLTRPAYAFKIARSDVEKAIILVDASYFTLSKASPYWSFVVSNVDGKISDVNVADSAQWQQY